MFYLKYLTSFVMMTSLPFTSGFSSSHLPSTSHPFVYDQQPLYSAQVEAKLERVLGPTESRAVFKDVEQLHPSRNITALETAKAQLALYSPGFIDRLKAVMSQAEQAYAQNTTTLIIYLDAKRTYFDTLAEYYDALGNVAQSRADLESAIGVPLDLKP